MRFLPLCHFVRQFKLSILRIVRTQVLGLRKKCNKIHGMAEFCRLCLCLHVEHDRQTKARRLRIHQLVQRLVRLWILFQESMNLHQLKLRILSWDVHRRPMQHSRRHVMQQLFLKIS